MQDRGKLVRGNNEFAFDLYQTLGDSPDNLVFSPFSISYALGMTYAGARGVTARQMAKTLHFELPPERFHPALGALAESLIGFADPLAREGSTALRIANAIWAQAGFPYLPEFLDRLGSDYKADLKPADFAGAHEKVRQEINHWVAEQTESKIINLIPKGILDALTRMVLTNAIYFSGIWAKPFSKSATRPGPFYKLDGSIVEGTMMSMASAETFDYRRTRDGLQLLALPYQDRRLEMVILFPEGGQFSKFSESLTESRLTKLRSAARSKLVRLTMPSFRCEAGFSLAETLAEMGMPDAFAGGEADFSGMDGSRNLSISHVIHRAFVAVDEAGTEAAAATAVVMAVRSMPMADPALHLVLDRPFIYLIRDRETGTILFLGRLLDPAV